jgi:hypothetical protein
MKSKIRWLRVLGAVSTMCFVAIAFSVVAAIVWEGADFEIALLGLMAVTLSIPSMLGYVVSVALWPRRNVHHVVFWVLFVAATGLLIPTALFPSAGASSDGADEIALAILVPLVVGGLAAYSIEQWLKLARADRLTSRVPGVCLECGYPTRTSPVCTECGKAVTL